MCAVWQREFKSHMNHISGWLFVVAYLLAGGISAAYFNFYVTTTTMRGILINTQYAIPLVMPLLCMRAMTEDRHNGSDLLYLSLPISPTSLVLGKYLALLSVAAIPVGVFCIYPLIFSFYGTVSFSVAYTSVLACFLLNACLLAVCMYLSTMTANRILSFSISCIALLVIYFLPLLAVILPNSAIASFLCLLVLAICISAAVYVSTRHLAVTGVSAVVLILPLAALLAWKPAYLVGLFERITTAASPFVSFENIIFYEIFDLPSLVVLASYTVFFVFLTVQRIRRKRFL